MDPKTNFPLIVIQTELERFKFLMRSLIRARIAKVRSHGVRAITNQIALCVYPRTDTQTLPSFVHRSIRTHTTTSRKQQRTPRCSRTPNTSTWRTTRRC